MSVALSVVWYKVIPPGFGGQNDIYNFNKWLSRRLDLVCLCSSNNEVPENPDYEVLPLLPVSPWQFFSRAAIKLIVQTARDKKADYLILEHPYHAIAAGICRKKLGCRVIIHSHNIESERFRRQGRKGWPLLRWLEKKAHRQADLSLFKTEEDQAYAISQWGLKPDACLVVPYGVEAGRAPQGQSRAAEQLRINYEIGEDEKILMFNGTLDYLPNARAVEAIVHHLVPELDQHTSFKYRIIICGRNELPGFEYLKAIRHPRIIMAGRVPDIQPFLLGADVFINTVRSGGGIQTKLVDALAHNLNAVCFSQMRNGLPDRVCGNKLAIVPDADWPQFAVQTIRMAAEKTDTPEVFFTHFNWETLIGRVMKHLEA